MRKGHSWFLLARGPAVFVLLSVPRFAAAQQADAGPRLPLMIPPGEVAANLNAEIEEAIARLGSPDFLERQSAQQRLMAAGGTALPALAAAAQSDDREVAVRCIAVLRELAREEPHSESALAALKELAAQDDIPLARHAQSVYVDLTQTELERATARLTAAGVQLLSLSNGKVTTASNIHRNSHLSQLAHFPGLRIVKVSGPQVTDAGMESLSQLSKLFSLSLVRTSVTGAGLRQLQEIPGLSKLGLTADTLSVDDLRQLKHLSRLHSLSLISLADEGQLRFLEDVEQIGRLSLGTVRLSREGIDVLNAQANLRHVGLSLDDVGDEQLRELSRLKAELDLTLQRSPEITDAGWRCLEGAAIRSLTIMQSNLTDAGMASIAECGNLERLMIVEAPISDASVDHLLALPRLRYLSLHKTEISEEGRKRLQKERPGLRLR